MILRPANCPPDNRDQASEGNSAMNFRTLGDFLHIPLDPVLASPKITINVN